MPELPMHKSVTDKLYQEERNKNFLIVKGNRIVQHAHFTMSLADQKVLASLIRSIKPGQKSLKVKFSTNKFIKMLGLSNGGKTFNQVMDSLYSIANDNFFIQLPDGHYHMWFWLKDIDADPKHGGNFVVTFRPELKKYLFAKSLRYRTIYKFSDIMLMKSHYSIRLYEIFRSNQSRQKVRKRGLNYKISELKYLLNLMYRQNLGKRGHVGRIKRDKHGNIKYKYPRFTDFKKRVLKPAVKEINYFTEYNIRIRVIRKHRKAVKVNVVMLKKNKQQRIKRNNRIYFITHHIPKSEWPTWKQDIINGAYHKIKPRTSRLSNRKEVNGQYKIIKPKKSHGNVYSTHLKFDKTPSKQRLKQLDDYLDKHKVPFKEVNMGPEKMEYYNPVVNSYVWTTRSEWKKQYELYISKEEIQKKEQKYLHKFKKTRSKQNRRI